jgi:hypothetical protein
VRITFVRFGDCDEARMIDEASLREPRRALQAQQFMIQALSCFDFKYL